MALGAASSNGGMPDPGDRSEYRQHPHDEKPQHGVHEADLGSENVDRCIEADAKPHRDEQPRSAEHGEDLAEVRIAGLFSDAFAQSGLGNYGRVHRDKPIVAVHRPSGLLRLSLWRGPLAVEGNGRRGALLSLLKGRLPQ